MYSLLDQGFRSSRRSSKTAKVLSSAVGALELLEPRRLMSVASISAPDAEAIEGSNRGGDAWLRVALDVPSRRATSVYYSVDRRGTASIADVSPLVGVVRIPANRLSADIKLTAVDDSTVEGDEKLVVRLLEGEYTINSRRAVATVTVIDNDRLPQATPQVVRIAEKRASSTENDAAAAAFTVTRTGDLSRALTVSYLVAGTASAGDFAPLGNTVTFSAGQSSVDVTLDPLTDNLVEGNESVILILTGGLDYAVDQNHLTATVTINDTTTGGVIPGNAPTQNPTSNPAVVGIVSVNNNTKESVLATNTFATFLVYRQGPTDAALDVYLNIAGSATNGVDYATIAPMVTLAAGESYKLIHVNVLDDTISELSETVVLSLLPTTYTIDPAPGRATTTITISSEGTANQVSLDAYSGPVHIDGLPDDANRAGVIRFRRSGDISGSLTVFYDVSGTASASDFTSHPLTGSVTFAAGQDDLYLDLGRFGNLNFQGSKTLTLSLHAGPGYLFNQGRPTATVSIQGTTIAPADIPTVQAYDSGYIAESSAEAGFNKGFNLNRSGSLVEPLIVYYSISGTASTGDFRTLTGAAIFPAGQHSIIVPVQTFNDALSESTETIVLTLTPQPGAYTVDSSTTGLLKILDDDSVTVGIRPAAARATEGGVAHFTLYRTGNTDLPLYAHYSIESGTAVAGTDFTGYSEAYFAEGKTQVDVEVSLTDDVTPEPEEIGLLKLDAGNYKLDAGHTFGNVQIVDNDNRSATGWLDAGSRYRVAIDVANYASNDTKIGIAERSMNFTTLFNQLGRGGMTFDPSSLRVVETNAAGTAVLDSNVAFQFEKSTGYNATTNAAGTLVFEVKSTASKAARRFDVYFDDRATTAPIQVTELVSVNENAVDNGNAAIAVRTRRGTYYLRRDNGALTSLIDSAGNDWIADKSATRPLGMLDETVNPLAGFLPTFHDAHIRVVSTGPLRSIIQVDATLTVPGASTPSNYSIQYLFTADGVQVTALQVDNEGPAQWLLAATPGGKIDPSDYVGFGAYDYNGYGHPAPVSVTGFQTFNPRNYTSEMYQTAGQLKFTFFTYGRAYYYLADANGAPATSLASADSYIMGLGQAYYSTDGLPQGAWGSGGESRQISITLGTGAFTAIQKEAVSLLYPQAQV